MSEFRTGDTVWITCGPTTVLGTVVLASPNGKSIMLNFEGMLGGHVHGMPIFHGDDGLYRSIMDGLVVTLKPA